MAKGFMRLMTKINSLISAGRIGRVVVLTYLLIVFIPSAVMLYAYYAHTVRSAEFEVVRAKQNVLSQTQTNISYQIKAIEHIADMLFVNPAINTALTTDSNGQTVSQQKEERDLILREIKGLANAEGVRNIKIYIMSDKLYQNERVNFFPYADARQYDWFPDVETEDGAIYWSGVQLITDETASLERVLTCARLLKDLNHIDRTIGIIAIDVSEQIFTDILQDAGFSADMSLRLIDDKGEVKVGNRENPPDIRNLPEGITEIDGGYQLVSAPSKNDWKLTATISELQLSENRNWSGRFYGVSLIMILFCLLILTYFVIFSYVVQQINRRIRQIARKIEENGVTETVVLPKRENGDFHNLESQIDVMINHIQDLVKRFYSAEIEKKDAELKMFQAQINPHFLYNTLNSINWMALRCGATEVGKMIQLLSQYFRLNLSDGRDMVRVRDEIELAKTYLEIQNNRFMGIISATFDVKEDILDEQIPKLTFQPILENAILHGLQYKGDKDWKLTVAAWSEGQDIVFRVTDNGVGMTRAKVESVMTSIHEEHADGNKTGGYGLYNVARRLALRYGNENSLEIRSDVGKGTEVELHIARKEVPKNNE